jgi:predicted transcriptional regulator
LIVTRNQSGQVLSKEAVLSDDMASLDLCDPSERLSLASELFHRINRIIPEGQTLLTVPVTCLVRDAVRSMISAGYSQIPVMAGSEVVGVFSYRSFSKEAALASLEDFQKQRTAPGDLRVDEFLEEFRFARVTEELSDVFDAMDRDNGVLIGTPENLIGILTPMDFLRYLHQMARPFVLISEIELALRALIAITLASDDLAALAKKCLASAFASEDQIPTKLEDMTFDNYVSLITNGDAWINFEAVFGPSRPRASARLKQVRDIRNDTFHFKREITTSDADVLAEQRNWLLVRVKQHERQSTALGEAK